jgi:RF-1 domain
MSQRQHWAEQTDEQLLAQCDIDTYRASGPGGQKRNKTSSAVRLRHSLSGLIVIAEESRSQHENKARALRRLRQTIWLDVREPLNLDHPALANARDGDGRFAVGKRDPNYLPAVAVILDVLDSTKAALRDAAALLGTTTANLVHFLGADDRVWRATNTLRARHHQTPLQS